jgi:putative SOS response-associated peptidase YedK
VPLPQLRVLGLLADDGVLHDGVAEVIHHRRDGEDAAQPRKLAAIRRPFPPDLMRMWPISTRVNKPENDDPSIVEPIELATDAA